MREIEISADRLVASLIRSGGRGTCILDSCGVGKPGSNLLIVGSSPSRTICLTGPDPETSLSAFEERLTRENIATVFTMSYEFGVKLNSINPTRTEGPGEPDVFLAAFENLIVHDYDENRTRICGNPSNFDKIEKQLLMSALEETVPSSIGASRRASSNYTRAEYLEAVREIKDLINAGETYQTNLTQQLQLRLRDGDTPGAVFQKLRKDHPAAYAAYLDRGASAVVSASPEQFIRVDADSSGRRISASPIKGTRPRGATGAEDIALRRALLQSEKDRAENTMIVDLMRNDLGRVCEFGSVAVDSLCRIEEHPTLFHLVSNVSGTLRPDADYSDILRATFPCGSITGAPKIRTMEIIDRLEPNQRGLSMGAIGCRIPEAFFGREIFEMSVAIRTIVFKDDVAVFNVGGGVVSDSDPEAEYAESLLKAQAILTALGASFDERRTGTAAK